MGLERLGSRKNQDQGIGRFSGIPFGRRGPIRPAFTVYILLRLERPIEHAFTVYILTPYRKQDLTFWSTRDFPPVELIVTLASSVTDVPLLTGLFAAVAWTDVQEDRRRERQIDRVKRTHRHIQTKTYTQI